MGEHEVDWDDYIDPVLFSIRTSIQEYTKFTPFFIMHGREARLPLEAENRTVTSPSQLAEMTQTIDRLSKIRENIFPKVRANIESSQTKQKEQYSRRKGIVKRTIHVGNTVLRLNMLKRTKKGHKMEDTWFGPYKVLEVTSHGGCVLQCMKTNTTMKRKVNIRQLKLYSEPQMIQQAKMTGEKVEEQSHIKKTEGSTPKDIDLEHQLFDDSLLRLWRTGAHWEAWKSADDDDYEVSVHLLSQASNDLHNTSTYLLAACSAGHSSKPVLA